MMVSFKRVLRKVLTRTSWGFRFYYKRDHQIRGPHGMPEAPWHNAVLQSQQEVDDAADQVRRLGLPPSPEISKNWDSLAALDVLMRNTKRNARILDAGGERYSVILPWLALYGYTRLEAWNLVFPKTAQKMGPITYRYGDITAVECADGTFDGITCLSVIEHGVDLNRYFREMARILRPGGILVTSTDYFETPIETGLRTAYGAPIHVFTRCEIEEALRLAREAGFELTSPLDLQGKDRPVHWKARDLCFTFLVFTMRKTMGKGESSCAS